MPHSPVPAGPDNSHQPTERERFPDHFTFSQRYGYEPLPEPMQLKQLSGDLRRDVWDVIYYEFLEDIMIYYHEYNDLYSYNCEFTVPNISKESSVEEKDVVRHILGRIKKCPRADINASTEEVIGLFKPILLEKEFNRVLDCLEIIFYELEEVSIAKHLAKKIGVLFEKHSAAYWLDTSQHPYWFFPRASREQGEAVQEAIETLHQGKMNNATTHFRKATEDIKMQEYEASVRESILAVESIACEIDPKPNKTLGEALKSLGGKGFFPGNANRRLKQALEKLYGYASDSVRHGKPEGSTVEVGLDEAMLLYGTCASFAAYLTRKHQSRENRQDLKEKPE